MSAIRSTNNRTERTLRRTLHRLGLRYRLYYPGLPGKPDIVFPKARVAIFVDGDFWHARLLRESGIRVFFKTLRTKNRDYWLRKLTRNSTRDDAVTAALRDDGWEVIRLWETDIKKDVSAAAKNIAHIVRSKLRATKTT